MTGTCPICGQRIAIVNYGRETHRGVSYEVGYLGRHGRPGVRRDAKCRGSIGSWAERKH